MAEDLKIDPFIEQFNMQVGEAFLGGVALIQRGAIEMFDWRQGQPVFVKQANSIKVQEYKDNVDPEADDIKLTKVGISRNYYTQAATVGLRDLENWASIDSQVLQNTIAFFVSNDQRKFTELYFEKNLTGINWGEPEGFSRTIPWNFRAKALAPAADDDIVGLSVAQLFEARTRLENYDFECNLSGNEASKIICLIPNILLPSLVSDEAFRYSITGEQKRDLLTKSEDSAVYIKLPFLERFEFFSFPVKFWKDNNLYTNDVDGNRHVGIYVYCLDSRNIKGTTSIGQESLYGNITQTEQSIFGNKSFIVDTNHNNSAATKFIKHTGMEIDNLDKNYSVRIACRLNNDQMVIA